MQANDSGNGRPAGGGSLSSSTPYVVLPMYLSLLSKASIDETFATEVEWKGSWVRIWRIVATSYLRVLPNETKVPIGIDSQETTTLSLYQDPLFQFTFCRYCTSKELSESGDADADVDAPIQMYLSLDIQNAWSACWCWPVVILEESEPKAECAVWTFFLPAHSIWSPLSFVRFQSCSLHCNHFNCPRLHISWRDSSPDYSFAIDWC